VFHYQLGLNYSFDINNICQHSLDNCHKLDKADTHHRKKYLISLSLHGGGSNPLKTLDLLSLPLIESIILFLDNAKNSPFFFISSVLKKKKIASDCNFTKQNDSLLLRVTSIAPF